MLKPNQKVAIYMQGFLHSDFGKMGLGIIRYSENPIVGIIDSENAGSNINREYKIDSCLLYTSPSPRDRG